MLAESRQQTIIEYVLTICILYGTFATFSYLLSNINIEIQELNNKSKKYKDDLENISDYLNQ